MNQNDGIIGGHMLKISFLGKLHFEYKNFDITDKVGTKTAALIALLMLQENKNMSREKAITYLWPDSNEEAAKYNLRYNFWLLKRLIGEDDKGEHFLNIDKDYCGINAKYSFKCDILELLKFDSNKDYELEKLLEIKSILCGDFFEGHYFNNCDDFNELILFERNNFENKKIKLFKKLAQAYEDLKKYEESIGIVNEIFKLDPYSEETAVKALHTYSLNKDRAGAVKFYKDFSNKLISDLGIRPSNDLVSKYNEIKLEKIEASLEEQSKNSLENVEITTYCMKNVDFFWIAEVVEKISNHKNFRTSEFESYVLRDLMYIVPNIVDENMSNEDIPQVPAVRIIKACISFLRQFCKNNLIDINIINFSDMDAMSYNIYKYIADLNIQNVKVRKTDRSNYEFEK